MKNSSLQVVDQQSSKIGFELTAPSTFAQGLDAKANLEDADGRYPDRFSGTIIQPAADRFVGLPAHQRRNHIGVESDHSSKSAGCACSPRNSGIWKSMPRPANRRAIRVPRPPVLRLSSLTALRRMSRTSSSTLRR